VNISVTRSRDASTVAVANKIRELARHQQDSLAKGTKIEVTQDGGKDAENSLRNVIDALIFGAMLTIFVVYAFLNSWRSTLITALSLPTSAIAAFIAIWACGFTLNFMTLLGLSLAIGVLIDDAIVVRENIVRHMEAGEDRLNASRNGTAEIGLAVTATTFSIIAVFIPVAFMGGGAGEWFRPFALTVAASVLVSLYISFTLDPMLSAYWGDPIGYRQRDKRGISKWLHSFNEWFDHQADRYGNVIAWALHHRKWMMAFAIATFVFALAVQAIWGSSTFLPASDYGTIAIDVRTPSSASLEYAKLKTEKAAELARTLPETVATNTVVYAGGGRVYVDVGKVNVRKSSRSVFEIAVDLRGRLAQLVGAEYVVMDDLNQGVRKPVQIQFTGPDYRRLMAITNVYMDQVRKIPGAVDVGLSEQEPKDELKIELDRGLANNLGISVGDAAQALRVAFAGVEVGDWIDPTGETRDVAVRLHPDDRVDASNIERLPIAVTAPTCWCRSTRSPTSPWARARADPAPGRQAHGGVAANTQGRASGEVTSDALKLAKSIEFPQGYGITLGGASRDQQEVFSEMFTALIMGIALMYLVLVMQFGSFTAPLP
jgi:HAE1 family hydrophobic/amphiphilic exporter-1